MLLLKINKARVDVLEDGKYVEGTDYSHIDEIEDMDEIDLRRSIEKKIYCHRKGSTAIDENGLTRIEVFWKSGDQFRMVFFGRVYQLSGYKGSDIIDDTIHDDSEIPAKAMESSALTFRSKHYPVHFKGRVPLKVRLDMTVHSDLPFSKVSCQENSECYVWVNSHGAVSAILEEGNQLGLKPHEFTIVQWHDQASVCG